MLFHVKLFRIAVAARMKYVILAFVPALAYLVVMGLIPHNFQINQTLAAPDQTLLSPGVNPLDMVTLASVLKDPQHFLTDNHVLMDLREQLLTGDRVDRPQWAGWLPSRFAVFIKRAVLQDMIITSIGDDRITIGYQGDDRELGVALVDFYSQRLIRASQRAQERAILRPELLVPQEAGTASTTGVTLQGAVSVNTSTVLISPDRIWTAIWLLIIFIIIALAAIWIMEMARPKLYTERQASRYLDTPVLGAIPNLERMKQF